MLSKHKKKINKIIKQTMTDMAVHVAKKLTDEAVPVRTGDYIKNHVVQTVEPSYPRFATEKKPPYSGRLSPSESAPIRNPVEARLKATTKALIKNNNTICNH